MPEDSDVERLERRVARLTEIVSQLHASMVRMPGYCTQGKWDEKPRFVITRMLWCRWDRKRLEAKQRLDRLIFDPIKMGM